ncbi:hypothetical protein AAC387_Pa10g1794 [Persea americana]
MKRKCPIDFEDNYMRIPILSQYLEFWEFNFKTNCRLYYTNGVSSCLSDSREAEEDEIWRRTPRNTNSSKTKSSRRGHSSKDAGIDITFINTFVRANEMGKLKHTGLGTTTSLPLKLREIELSHLNSHSCNL